MIRGKSLYDFPIHLGLGATAVAEPEFNGMDWYEATIGAIRATWTRDES
nr:hypothetical protein [uncultured bacterium]